MAKDINMVTLHGRLGADPDIRELSGDGGKVAYLSVATSERWKDEQSGEWQQRTQWHRVAVFNQALVELAELTLQKSSEIEIEGQLENRQWVDRQNIERYSTEVVVRPFKGKLTVVEPIGGPEAVRPTPAPKTQMRDAEPRPAA